MKLTKLIFVIALAIAAVGCNKDDDSSDSYEFNQTNLRGTYSLNFFKSKEVETVNVNGFDVVTTTTKTGDTFDATADFASDNTVTYNGTYRVTIVVKQGDQTNEDAEIIVLDNETEGYSVNAAAKELTIDGSTYKMSNFTPTGFTLKLSETTTESNGDNTVYTEEIRLSK
jgi:hypothetical protein